MADIFVEMVKDGEHLIVHPTTVRSHQAAGWTVVKEGVALPSKEKKEESAAVKEPPADGKK